MARRKKRRKNATRKPSRRPSPSQAEAKAFDIPWPEPKPGLEAAVDLVEQHVSRPFHLQEVVAEIQRHAHIRNPRPQEHIRSLLAERSDLACIPSKALYIPGRNLFRDTAFYIQPTEQELAEGILVPGHRFYPFMSFSVAPNLAQLCTEERQPFPQRTVTRPFEDLVIYHTLIGIPEMLLLCQSDEDEPPTEPEAPLKMEVYDLSSFYETHGFSGDDLILARVLDYATGRFQLRYAGAQSRLALRKDTVERDAQLTRVLLDLMEAVDLRPPLYLLRDAYAHLFQEGIDLSKPATPFGILLRESAVALEYYYNRPCLVPRGENPVAFYGEAPIPVYDGRCETLADIFVKGDLSLSMSYVRAAILDDLGIRKMGKQAVAERILAGRTVHQWNRADWRFFRQEFDRLWDEIEGQHQDLSSGRKAQALRSRILEQYDAHLAFLRELDRIGILPDELPMQEMAQMASFDGICDQTLQVLEDATDTAVLQLIEENLDAMAAQWHALREQVEAAILEDEDEDWEEDEDEDWKGEEEVKGPVTTYVLKVTFKAAKRIWRKIEIAGPQTLDHLHFAIQDAIDWDADHLYSFYMSNRPWDRETEVSSPYAEDGGRRADRVRIGELDLRPKQKFLYLFDYGDSHAFDVEVVEIRPDMPTGQYPRVIEARGEAPEQYPEW